MVNTQSEKKERLNSLDTLRGFDMLWISGGGMLVIALAKATGWGWLEHVAEQMEHVAWNGFHFEDLIFPLFMFISGVAIPFALTSRLEKGTPKSVLHKKVFTRMVLLIVFGLLYNGMLKNGFSGIRVASVLSQIGIAYFFAAMIVINTKTIKLRVFWLLGIWVLITVLQQFVSISGFGGGNFTPDGTINAWFDQHFFPGKLHYNTYDPEGILCIVSAITVTLLGSFAGFLLREKTVAPEKKTVILLGAGAVLIIIALALSPIYPIIKKVWTVPFDMLTAGISSILLAIFYFIIDVKKWNKWILFFKVIGLNSITIYLGSHIIDFSVPSKFFLGSFSLLLGDYGNVLLIIGFIAAEWLALYYLYKKKIFLKV